MNLWLIVGAFVLTVLYFLSIRTIGHRLAVSSWNVWNTKQTGSWAYFLFPFSSQFGRIGYRSRYGYFINPPIVEIGNSCDISLRGGRWEQEGREDYIAKTAMVWPLKILSSSICCITTLTLAAFFKVCSRACQFMHRFIYRWTGAV